MKKVTITADEKKYTLMFNRKTAAMYGDMGYEISDISGAKAFDAIIAFVWCAFKANHPSIKRDKVETIWGSVPLKSKNDVVNALVEMYVDTYTSLIGDPNANDEDNEGNAATVELFEE